MYMYFIIYQQSKKKVMCDAICVDMIILCDMAIYEYAQSVVFRDLDLRKRRRYISSVRKHNFVLMFTCKFINDLFLATKTPNYICNNE